MKSKKPKIKYKSSASYNPYDGTHGFKLDRQFFDNGDKTYTIICKDCDNKLEVHLFPDKLYPHVEIGGVLLGWETAERIFAEIFSNKKDLQIKG